MKKNGRISVKNEKLFEQSEFFSFRKFVHFLVLEREPAIFLFVSFFFLLAERKRKNAILPSNYEAPYPHAELPNRCGEPLHVDCFASNPQLEHSKQPAAYK